MLNYIKKSLILLIIPIFLASCGGFNRSESAKNQPVNAKDRVKKNIESKKEIQYYNKL